MIFSNRPFQFLTRVAICTIRFFFSNNSALRPAFEFIRFFSGEVILVILFGSAFSVLGEGVYFDKKYFSGISFCPLRARGSARSVLPGECEVETSLESLAKRRSITQ